MTSRFLGFRRLAAVALLSVAPAALAQVLTRYALGGNNQPQQLVNAPDASLFCADFNGSVARIAMNGDVTRISVGNVRAIVAGADGNMWAAETGAIYRITPALVNTLGVPFGWTGNNISLANGPDGNVWALLESDVAQNPGVTYHPELASITPSGTVTKYPLPQEKYTDLVRGPDGELWCSHELPDGSHALTTISTSGDLTDVPVNTVTSLAGKIVAPDGTFWAFGPGIVQVATDGTVLQSYPLSATQLAIGADGNVWYVSGGVVGKIVPADGSAWTFADVPAAGTWTGYGYIHTGIARGSDDQMWVAERYFSGVPPPATLAREVAPTATPVSNGQFPTIIAFGTSVAMTLDSKPKNLCNFDGDYTSDLFWRNSVTGDDAIWYFRGYAGQNTPIRSVPNPDWTIAGSGDFNGDGHADLLWRDSQTGYTAVWLEAGGGFTNVPGPMVSLDWTPRVVGDVDGDGKADVVWRSTTTGDDAIWLMNGGTHTNMALPAVADTEWSIRGAADLDGDGIADLFWKRSTGETAVWYMDAALSHSNVPMSAVGPGWEPVALGKTLVIWRNSDNLAMAYWLMGGDRTLQFNINMYIPPNRAKDASWSVAAAADFTGTGKLDLLWRRTSGETVMWNMNDGYVYGEIPLATVSDSTWQIVTPR
ncbi:MAG: repeat protein [Acidobacteria bacterium]|nr:repeat protein [Acidobacteriota bacterium]